MYMERPSLEKYDNFGGPVGICDVLDVHAMYMDRPNLEKYDILEAREAIWRRGMPFRGLQMASQASKWPPRPPNGLPGLQMASRASQ